MKKQKHNYGENAQFFTASFERKHKGKQCSDWYHTNASSLGVAKAIATNRKHTHVGLLHKDRIFTLCFKQSANIGNDWVEIDE